MNKILTDLTSYYTNENKIYWNKLIKTSIKILYKNEEHDIYINNYNTKTSEITILIDNKIKHIISRDDFLKVRFAKAFKIVNDTYKFEIGEEVDNKTIIKQIRMDNGVNKNGNPRTCKAYLVQCKNDGYKWNITEYNLIKKRGCPVCANKIIITGVNDIATTHPHLVKYFANIEDAKTNTVSNTSIVDFKCPNCGFIKTRKIDGISREGFSCPKCGDGKSIPEKLMFNVLEQSCINFEVEKTFDWSKGKRYDFYIPSLNCIIETHGSQHYYENNRGGRTLKEEQENDRIKKELAKENNTDYYIIIDCKGDLNSMKNNILHSKLFELLNLSNINWIKSYEFSYSSRVKEACDLWNGGIKSTKEIGLIMKMNSNTINTYLKQGNEINWCDYTPTHNTKGNSKKVLFVEENKVFSSIKELCNYLTKTFNCSFTEIYISKVCKNLISDYKGYHFQYIN